MQRNAICSKTFATNVLPVTFEISPYFLIFKKIKSITQISLDETKVFQWRNSSFLLKKLQFFDNEINKNCNWLINSNYTIISSPAYISKNEPAYVGDEAAGLNAP